MGHTFTHLIYHVVFSTKDRRPLIKGDLQPRLIEYMAGIARQEFGRAIALGGTDNHMHALLSVRPAVSISEAVGKLKSLSSGWMNKSIRAEAPLYWQKGYAAFSVSESARGQVETYLARQAEHHRKVTFEEEFVAFLKRHGIDYDPATIWD